MKLVRSSFCQSQVHSIFRFLYRVWQGIRHFRARELLALNTDMTSVTTTWITPPTRTGLIEDLVSGVGAKVPC
jgi:uncharacterized protein (DUF39 family)